MKKTLLSIGLALFALASQAAQSVTLAWDQNPETDLEGYVLAYSTASPTWTTDGLLPVAELEVPYPFTEGTFSGLTEGTTYHFAVKAVNIYGLESLWSDVVSYTVPRTPPTKPRGLRIVIVPAQ